MKSRASLVVAVVLSFGIGPVVTSFAAMGYGGGGSGGGGMGSNGGAGYHGGQQAERIVKVCKKGQVLNKATHTCVIASHKTHKSHRPSGMY